MQPPPRYTKVSYSQLPTRFEKPGQTRHGLIIVIASVIGLVWLFTFMDLRAHAAIPTIRSSLTGQCLDDYKGIVADNATVDAYSCNDTAAQSWAVTDTAIKHN